ncbi:uncharacterized protein LOC118105111 [Hippoglossus stenolepis]|uniref:uncharacterized protein LOC118105111 n=1 Tax=Hippoglossus stenolepis TaxID=195615 RepID=UPI001FAFDCD5|nr:uncharacterized protein LOC118105111 [Hippoglossus stenolepis]
MATCEEADLTVCGSDEEPSPQEDEEEEQLYRTPEGRRSKRPADILLDLSEEADLKELEPYQYHLYSGVEEAVCGWDRVAPLSCILLTQKKDRKWTTEPKEADKPTISADPTPVTAESSASIAEQRCESRPGLCNQQGESCINNAVAALQLDITEWPFVNAMQKTTSHHFPETTEEGWTLGATLRPHHLSTKCTVSEKRHIKPQKHSHRPNSTVVPIKTYTFLPPIKPPHLNPKVDGQTCSGRKASGGVNLQERGFMLDKRSGRRGRREEPVANAGLPNHPAALTSTHQTCHHNAPLSYAGSVSIPKGYQLSVSSKPDTEQYGRYMMGESLTRILQGSTAAGAQTHLHPSCLFS